MPRELRDVVFVDGVRTPFGKAGSMYAETRADDLVVNCPECGCILVRTGESGL